ncbi:hypothetical protein [Pseudomonas asiatica]|uniref:hypothetical protein n=1 Tax=Pseudomonas asiatica TaxID=2219225 RepID=UPI0035266F7F
MKIQALGPLTGASGEREKGEIFDLKKEEAEGLIARGWAVAIVDTPLVNAKPAKADQAKE